VPTNKQRREAARRHLERQLQRRQEREAARRRFTLIASIVGTVALIAIILIVVVMSGSDHKKTKTAASSTPPASPSTSAAATSPSASSTVRPAVGKSVTFAGVTVHGAADLGGAPEVTSTSTSDPTKLEVKDLVVGKGKAASPTSTVSVEYVGVLYKNGVRFDSSWDRGGQPISFPLTGVVKGFTEGIGGTTGVAPMRVGGRRIIIMPASLGYGSQANGQIPANSPLVFVVDLKSVS
jgi:peptidylprolyl isomerase